MGYCVISTWWNCERNNGWPKCGFAESRCGLYAKQSSSCMAAIIIFSLFVRILIF
jgi:hypothetical protein